MTELRLIKIQTDQPKVSYSSLTQHRQCPQAWAYKHVFGLGGLPEFGAKPELHFGSWWHALRAAEAIERGRALGTLKSAPDKIKTTDDGPTIEVNQVTRIGTGGSLVEDVLQAADEWWTKMSEDHKETWTKKLNVRDLRKHLVMTEQRYAETYGAQIAHEEPIAIECGWGRTLPGLEKRLVGYTDEVYRDTRRGMTCVRDHKTTSKMYGHSPADDLMDSQLHLNAWGLNDRLKEWGAGAISAVGYSRTLSVGPSWPKLTLKGALSKQVTNFDLATYRDFCQSPEAVEKGYQEDPAVVARLSEESSKEWFQRTLTPLNRHVIRAHLQSAVDTAQDTIKTMDRVVRRGEAPRNFSKGCGWCDFSELCRSQVLGGPEGAYPLEDFGLKTRFDALPAPEQDEIPEDLPESV
jgi:hypothetical protein